VVRSGILGRLHKIEARINLRSDLFAPNNIRYDYALGGGAALDPGNYCVSMARLVTGEEPRVSSARATLIKPDIDVAMEAELVFPGGCTAELEMSLAYEGEMEIRLVVHGEKGVLDIKNPIVPHMGHEWTLEAGGEKRSESFDMTPTFVFQFREAAEVVANGRSIRTSIRDGILNMRVIDAIYAAAGMRRRGESS
jgi:predicted dehydrogenase